MIRESRRDEHVTQEELARRIGSTKSYISRVENGNIDPGVGIFSQIIHALGLQLEIVKPAL
jgi:predicted transcriptional regulator